MQPACSNCITELATEIPRCFSTSIQSEVACRPLLRALTVPAIWIAPPNSSSFSVSVVLPASGWAMIAKLRRRRTSRTSSGPPLVTAVTGDDIGGSVEVRGARLDIGGHLGVDDFAVLVGEQRRPAVLAVLRLDQLRPEALLAHAGVAQDLADPLERRWLVVLGFHPEQGPDDPVGDVLAVGVDGQPDPVFVDLVVAEGGDHGADLAGLDRQRMAEVMHAGPDRVGPN